MGYLFLNSRMHTKDFDGWSINKKFLDGIHKDNSFIPRIGEVRLIKIWVNIWSEQNGKWDYLRPILVLSICGGMIIGLPMTTKSKWSLYNFGFEFKSTYLFAMINQIRSMDKKRFIKCMWTVQTEILKQIKKLLVTSFHLQGV